MESVAESHAIHDSFNDTIISKNIIYYIGSINLLKYLKFNINFFYRIVFYGTR